MQDEIKKLIEESIFTKQKALDLAPQIEEAAKVMIDALKNGKKILACGNGGSAADAQHFVAELVCKFEKPRKPLPAIALTTNTSSLTAIGNDYYGFWDMFKRQVDALGNEGDVLLAISTSGVSPNVVRAIEKAKEKNMKVIGLTGGDAGKMKELGTFNIVVQSSIVARIQECHIMIIHVLCRLIDNELVKNE